MKRKLMIAMIAAVLMLSLSLTALAWDGTNCSSLIFTCTPAAPAHI